MNLWRKLKRISFPKLVGFGLLFLKRPLLILPTWKATKQTYNFCQKEYGNAQNRNGKANAFRHAYWNYKICKNSLKFTKNDQKSSNWTQKVVDYYEKVTKNEILDRAMDMHNNAIGRLLFLANFEVNEQEMIKKLQNLAEKAVKVTQIEEIHQNQNKLVYISDTHV